AARGGRTGDHREALERGLGRLTARPQEEIAAVHLTPGAGSEHRRDRHVRSCRLARTDVELRELERFDDGVARLAREPRLAVVVAGPSRQRLTTEDVDGDRDVGAGGDDGFDGNGREAHRIDEAMPAIAPWRGESRERERRPERIPAGPAGERPPPPR